MNHVLYKISHILCASDGLLMYIYWRDIIMIRESNLYNRITLFSIQTFNITDL